MPQNQSKMVIDTSVQHKQIMEIFPEPGDLTAKTPLEFVIRETQGYFVDMKSILIDIKLRMVDEADEPAARNDFKSYFLNNLTQTLWSSVKVSLNNVNTESSFHNQQISHLNHILTTPDDLTRDRGVVQGAFPFRTDSTSLLMTTEHMAKPKTVERVIFSKQNGINIRGPLHLDISTSESFMLDGVTTKIILEPTNPQFLIKKKADDDCLYNYELASVKLIVTKIKPADPVLLATQKMILNNPIEYVLRRNIVHHNIIPAGRSEFSVRAPFQELIPNTLYVWFVDLEASTGRYHLEPFHWGSHNLSYYSVKINGVEISGGDCDTTGYINEYLMSLQNNNNTEHFIPYQDYMTGKFVLCFDTNNQSDQNSLNIDRRGNLDLSFIFKNALARSVRIYVTGAIDSTLEIDNDQTVTTNYQY